MTHKEKLQKFVGEVEDLYNRYDIEYVMEKANEQLELLAEQESDDDDLYTNYGKISESIQEMRDLIDTLIDAEIPEGLN